MCTLATEQTSQWLMVDPWEAFQSYQRTAVVLDHVDHEINTVLGGAQLPLSDERRHIRVMLLAGSDLISTMSEPGVWTEKDVSSSWCVPQLDEPPSPASLVGSHPRKVRHVHHRARRLRHGSRNGGACAMASQYLPRVAAHPKRCVVDQSPPVPSSWTLSALPSAGSRRRIYRRTQSIRRRRVQP